MLKKLVAVFALTMIGATASPLQAQPLLIHTAWDADDSPVLVDDITRAVNGIAVKFPEVRGATVTSELEPIGVYAYALRPKIALNDLYMSDPEIFNAMVHDDVEAGFHPSLGKCSPAEFVAIHESAHLIDQGKGKAPRTELVKRWLGGEGFPNLSGYSFRNGALNPGEALAEAFAAVICNGGNASEQALYDILIKVKPETA